MADIISIADKIDPKADISIVREATLSLKDKVIPKANSLRTHAKTGKGHYVLVHNDKTVINKGYIEKGTVYTANTIFCGTEKEVDAEIKRLGLKTILK